MIHTNKEEILIGLLSDTHIPQRTDKFPDVVLSDFKKRKIDYVFHMGDFTSFIVYKKLIETFGNDKVVAVRGNMDFDTNLIQTLPHRPVNEVSNGIMFFNPGTTTPVDNKLTVISSYGYLKISRSEIKPEIVYL